MRGSDAEQEQPTLQIISAQNSPHLLEQCDKPFLFFQTHRCRSGFEIETRGCGNASANPLYAQASGRGSGLILSDSKP
jgi:hypothetical protein